MGNCLKAFGSDDISLLRGTDASDGMGDGDQPPSYEESVPIYHPSPNISRPANQLTEDEQIKIAQRLGLISHLPSGVYDGSKKVKECAICMGELLLGDQVRFLPCMHIYHKECIDDWLMRSFTCPSCLEPVDAALLSLYEVN